MFELDNKWYKNIIDSMWEAIWIWDENGETVYANQVFLDIVEYSMEEAIGKKSFFFREEESVITVKENLKIRRKWEKSTYFWYLKSKTNKLIPVYTTWTPLIWWWTVWIITDLRIVTNYIDKINNLNLLVDNMLDLMMIINTDYKIDLEEISILSISKKIQNIIQKYEIKTKLNQTKVFIDLEKWLESMKIKSNLNALKEVFENIYAILIKFSKDSFWEIIFKISNKNWKILFEIIDNWKWIPKDLTKDVFSNFSNLEKIKENNNSGLELYISKKILEKIWSSLKIETKIWVWNIISFNL